MVCCAGIAEASSVTFTPRELFHVPFGAARDQLGARVEGGNFLIPRDFTRDDDGHFYLYDVNNHRIARYSSEGKYEMEFRYVASARQVFAHADARQNLWLLLSDPARGMFFGVYDANGKSLRSGVFARYNHFRLHPDDDNVLHILLSSDKDSSLQATYVFDSESLRMKKENIARPPETHHQLRHQDRVYFVDQVPGGSGKDSAPVNRVTDQAHRNVADIQGAVLYITERGEVYTRVGDCDIRVYGIDGSHRGKVHLTGLTSACAAIRFDPFGNIYEFDGIPDPSGRYNAAMPGMRVIEWERQ
jgi:hypothetical protein